MKIKKIYMPDIFYLIAKWWKQMLLITALSLITIGIIVFSERRQYLSVATALPASSSLADKSRIFNDNLEGLYSALGNPDDLDRVLGTAQLDTLYLSVTDQFNLWDHYKIKEPEEFLRFKSARLLRENSRIIKSDYGELKVKVWDTDKNLAPQLANALMEKLNSIHQNLQNESNLVTLNSLLQGKNNIQKQLDSLNNSINQQQTLKTLSDRLLQYDKLIGEYQLTLDTKPSVLVIVENARAADKPDRPDRILILAATGFLSFLFALALAIVFERRKKS